MIQLRHLSPGPPYFYRQHRRSDVETPLRSTTAHRHYRRHQNRRTTRAYDTRTRVTTPNRHLLLSTTTTPSTLRSALLSSLSYVFLSGRHGGVLSRIRLSYGRPQFCRPVTRPHLGFLAPKIPPRDSDLLSSQPFIFRPFAHDTASPRPHFRPTDTRPCLVRSPASSHIARAF